ncbi:hypothetical protein [Planktosalinus lacus]|uniref:Adenylosuccinate synthetase n=1 Tax=Planktosalinus lacus TaxID=1526573 RepID=A0A8J2VAN6_9FLAO|nr:hypothetical protein [Planktosalinus lacus]GGD94013.1 hypothetical protein GCM10011312_17170 [Planktosalinus lacus]
MKIKLVILSLLTSLSIVAQQPTHVPSPQNNTAIDLTNWVDILIFIVLPIALILIYFLWRRQLKKEQREARNKENNN